MGENTRDARRVDQQCSDSAVLKQEPSCTSGHRIFRNNIQQIIQSEVSESGQKGVDKVAFMTLEIWFSCDDNVRNQGPVDWPRQAKSGGDNGRWWSGLVNFALRIHIRFLATLPRDNHSLRARTPLEPRKHLSAVFTLEQ